MKNLVLMLGVVAFVFSACGNDEGSEVVSDVENVEEVVELSSVEDVEVVGLQASSELVDDTEIGFNYEAAMVGDQDFSTAWCAESAVGESLTVSLSDVVDGGVLGVVNGFARDEGIFKENNRVKNVEVYLSETLEGLDAEGVFVMEVELEDVYGMQFVDIEDNFKFVKLVVKDVYDGSKFDDTCLAEVDLQSDYVLERDAEGAMEFYEKNKKENALKPYDVVSSVKVVADSSSCEALELEPYPVGGQAYPLFMTVNGQSWIHVMGKINQYGGEDSELYAKWYLMDAEVRSGVGYSERMKDLGWLYIKPAEVEVGEFCGGGLYAHTYLDSDEIFDNDWHQVVPPGAAVGKWKVVFYNAENDKAVGSTIFRFSSF